MSDERDKSGVPPGASPISGLPPPVHTRWRKGQSGNPGGRPKGESMVALLRRVLEQEHHGRPLKEILAERLVKEALAGKFPFAKELLDRVEGPVSQKHEVAVEGGGWRAALDTVAGLSADELIDMAAHGGNLHMLPPELRERAAKRGLMPADAAAPSPTGIPLLVDRAGGAP